MSKIKILHQFRKASISTLAKKFTNVTKSPYLWALSGLLALILSLILGNQGNAQMQRASDEAAIKQVVLTALGSSLHVMVIPHTHPISASAASPKLALAASKADLVVAKNQAQTIFSSVYDAKCVPCQIEASKTYKALQAEGSGTFRVFAWGVRDIVWQPILFNGQTATITISATLWSKAQYVDEFGKLHIATPTGGEVMMYTLLKTGSTWLITNQVPDDAASSNLPANQQKPNGLTGSPPVGQPTLVKIDSRVKKLTLHNAANLLQ